MKILRYEDQRATPWKNGGGVTREIAVYSDPAVHPEFLWRVSMATVNEPGPFSRFEGVDRTIAVLKGAGIVLHAADGDTLLTREAGPHSFDGEADVTASIVSGETTDLNVMTRRGQFEHRIEQLVFDRSIAIDGETDETLIVFNNNATATLAERRFAGHALDGIGDIPRGARVYLTPEDRGEVYVIRIKRR
ncbi:hypothetical protein SAMN05892877_102279 [Rhizobium subbaraonis]|uniref:Environmental stress-induced protein Ves n=1 Tax=Rhizobium subbaraonis TaxID=908946 RepID=A0A285U2C6_9HYPH|nr:HutD family protein [Rhizobium subbaraonis]SOC35982.1 hypothetical protein SAMN05892877_102279 [Rhizobium subbaraonis]